MKSLPIIVPMTGTLLSANTTISPNAVLKGELKVSGSCRIEGAIHGNVTINENLYIGLKGYVRGKTTHPKLLIVRGSYAGNISAKKIFLKESCKIVKGQIETEELSHKKGCVIDAEIKLKEKKVVEKTEKISAAKKLK